MTTNAIAEKRRQNFGGEFRAIYFCRKFDILFYAFSGKHASLTVGA